MKKLLLLILISIIIALPVLAKENIYDKEYLKIRAELSSNIDMIKEMDHPSVEYVTADLYFFPKDDMSTSVTKFITNPTAENKGDYLQYKWTEFTDYSPYSLVAEVETVNWFNKVKQKIDFPIGSTGLRDYTETSKTIDSDNPAIIRKATELASGEDDLFIVVSKIAIWVKNNVEYDLSTQTADVSQKASWVLQNKQGVCDELTSLFIAMLRSLGIPAKFVSGLAYTTSPEFPQTWGAHGWAEVYFPTVGWVPFDPTYAEFGWVDPTHIKLKESIDPSEPSTRFTWRGSGFDVEFSPLKIDASVLEKGPDIPPVISIHAAVIKDKTGFGSYNLIKASIENLRGHYITAEIALGKTNDLETIDPSEKQIILKPGESKEVFWRVKLSSDLNEDYIYTIPVVVYDVMNTSSVTEFKSSSREPYYTQEDIDTLLSSLKQEEPETISKSISLECSPDNQAYAVGEKGTLLCTVTNDGNTMAATDVCFEGRCERLNLGISQDQLLSFDMFFDTYGERDIIATAKADGITETYRGTVTVMDKPVIVLEAIDAPSSVKYDDSFDVIIMFNKESASIPQDVVVTIQYNKRTDSTNYGAIDQDQKLKYSMKGSDLREGNNAFKVKITYEDDSGRQYKTEKQVNITLEKLSFFQKIAVFFKNLF